MDVEHVVHADFIAGDLIRFQGPIVPVSHVVPYPLLVRGKDEVGRNLGGRRRRAQPRQEARRAPRRLRRRARVDRFGGGAPGTGKVARRIGDHPGAERPHDRRVERERVRRDDDEEALGGGTPPPPPPPAPEPLRRRPRPPGAHRGHSRRGHGRHRHFANNRAVPKALGRRLEVGEPRLSKRFRSVKAELSLSFVARGNGGHHGDVLC